MANDCDFYLFIDYFYTHVFGRGWTGEDRAQVAKPYLMLFDIAIVLLMPLEVGGGFTAVVHAVCVVQMRWFML